MKLIKSSSDRICNNCHDKLDTRTFDIIYGDDRLPSSMCLCVKCLDELEGLISELGMFK